MRLKLCVLAVLLSCCFTQCGYSQKRQPADNSTAAASSSVVLELFTSEGCSSCPSADALMPELQELYKDKLIILSFHVDYWNRLGWKDVFSSSAYSQRQNDYATALRSDNVYTPQAIVNGKTGITGSNKKGIVQLIENELKTPAGAPITVQVKSTDSRHVEVMYSTAVKDNETVNIALIQQHATTNVRSGENGGRTLQHYNVVRDLRSSKEPSGTVVFTLPDNVSADNIHVITYVQRTGNMNIVSAKKSGIAN